MYVCNLGYLTYTPLCNHGLVFILLSLYVLVEVPVIGHDVLVGNYTEKWLILTQR